MNEVKACIKKKTAPPKVGDAAQMIFVFPNYGLITISLAEDGATEIRLRSIPR